MSTIEKFYHPQLHQVLHPPKLDWQRIVTAGAQRKIKAGK